MDTFAKAFAEAAKGALADLTADPTSTPSSTPVEASVETPESAAPTTPATTPVSLEVTKTSESQKESPAADETSAATTPEPVVTDENATKLAFVLKHRGKEVVISSESELKQLAQQGLDYTVKAKELADKRKAAEAEAAKLKLDATAELEALKAKREAEMAAMKEFLNNEELIQAYLLERREKNAPVETPDEVPTWEQVQKLTDAKVAEALQKERAAREKDEALMAAKAMQQQYQQAVTAKLEAVKASYPILTKIRNVDQTLLSVVAPQVQARVDADPGSVVPIEDIVDMIELAAKMQADDFSAVTAVSTVKQQVAETNTAMAATSIVPKGGTAAAPVAVETKRFKIGDQSLRTAALADIRRLAHSD